jgi:leader peptidase (prepilin peptidase)/N-methyltransferase
MFATNWPAAALAFVFGLLIGSFLNVCIHRWPRGRSVVRPRSHCVRCRKPIAWYDNIPVLSYVLLRGRCRYCGRPISLRYPAVELLTGVLFFCFVWKLGLTGAAYKMCVFAAILIALVFTDLEKLILPDELTLGGTLIGLGFSAFVPLRDESAMGLLWLMGFDLNGRAQSIGASVVGALLPAVFLWGGGWLYSKVRHRDGLGFGDVKLMVMVGSFLGLQGALATLLVGSLSGSIISLIYIRVTKKDAATFQLPFGTFLGLAALALALWAGYSL